MLMFARPVCQGGIQLGPIDVVVNNAGITRDAMMHKLTVKMA